MNGPAVKKIMGLFTAKRGLQPLRPKMIAFVV
jgi:hypothetical protein